MSTFRWLPSYFYRFTNVGSSSPSLDDYVYIMRLEAENSSRHSAFTDDSAIDGEGNIIIATTGANGTYVNDSDDWDFGTADFDITLTKVNLDSVTATNYAIINHGGGGSDSVDKEGWFLNVLGASGMLSFGTRVGTTNDIKNETFPFVAGVDYKIRVYKVSGMVSMEIDDIEIGTPTAMSQDINIDIAVALRLGRRDDHTQKSAMTLGPITIDTNVRVLELNFEASTINANDDFSGTSGNSGTVGDANWNRHWPTLVGPAGGFSIVNEKLRYNSSSSDLTQWYSPTIFKANIDYNFKVDVDVISGANTGSIVYIDSAWGYVAVFPNNYIRSKIGGADNNIAWDDKFLTGTYEINRIGNIVNFVHNGVIIDSDGNGGNGAKTGGIGLLARGQGTQFVFDYDNVIVEHANGDPVQIILNPDRIIDSAKPTASGRTPILPDISGYDNDVEQSVLANQPSFDSDNLIFDGTTDNMKLGNTLVNSGSWSAYSVVCPSALNSGYIWSQGFNATGTYTGVNFQPDGKIRLVLNSGDYLSTLTYTPGVKYVITVIHDQTAPSTKLYVNGVEWISVGLTETYSGDNFGIGAGVNDDRYIEGVQYAVLFRAFADTAVTRVIIEDLLADKYIPVLPPVTLDDYTYILRMEAENASRHLVTAQDDAHLDGNGACTFDGTDYLLVDHNSNDNLGTTFTIECHIYRTASGNHGYIEKRAIDSHYTPFQIQSDSGTGLSVRLTSTGSSWDVSIVNTLGLSAWTQVVIVADEGAVTVYKAGVAIGTGTISGALYVNTIDTVIGAESADGHGGMVGKMARVRISKGIARYSAPFTPPAYDDAIVNDEYDVLALDFDGTPTTASDNFSGIGGNSGSFTDKQWLAKWDYTYSLTGMTHTGSAVDYFGIVLNGFATTRTTDGAFDRTATFNHVSGGNLGDQSFILSVQGICYLAIGRRSTSNTRVVINGSSEVNPTIAFNNGGVNTLRVVRDVSNNISAYVNGTLAGTGNSSAQGTHVYLYANGAGTAMTASITDYVSLDNTGEPESILLDPTRILDSAKPAYADAPRHDIIVEGTAQLDGTGGLTLDGSVSTYIRSISNDWATGLDDFSFEMFSELDQLPPSDYYTMAENDAYTSTGWMLTHYSTGRYVLFAGNANASSTNTFDASAHHLLLVRIGGIFYLYVDGVLEITLNSVPTFDITGIYLDIGTNKQAGGAGGENMEGTASRIAFYDYATESAPFTPPLITDPVVGSIYNPDFDNVAGWTDIVDSVLGQEPAACPIVPDISGNEKDAEQSIVTKQALYDPSNLSLIFDGVDDFYSLAPAAFNLQRFTIFAVLTPTSEINNSSNGVLFGPDGSADKGIIFFGDSTSRLTGETVSMLNPNATDTYGVGMTEVVPANKTLMTFRLDGTDEGIWIDGVAKSLNTSSAGGLDSDGGKYFKDMKIIGANNSSSSFADMSLHALLIMDSAVSDTDRAEIETLLINKYAL